jgi:hypothetical protein
MKKLLLIPMSLNLITMSINADMFALSPSCGKLYKPYELPQSIKSILLMMKCDDTRLA